MKSQYLPSITAKLADIRPFADFVLVKRCDDERKGLDAPASVLIAAPGMVQNARGQMVQESDTAPRRGVVVAVGKGDRLFWLVCPKCPAWENVARRTETAETLACRRCGSSMDLADAVSGEGRLLPPIERCPMHVKPGDEVLYQFWRANLVIVEGEEYQFIHEESGILAVLEPDGAGPEWAAERGLA